MGLGLNLGKKKRLACNLYGVLGALVPRGPGGFLKVEGKKVRRAENLWRGWGVLIGLAV